MVFDPHQVVLLPAPPVGSLPLCLPREARIPRFGDLECGFVKPETQNQGEANEVGTTLSLLLAGRI